MGSKIPEIWNIFTMFIQNINLCPINHSFIMLDEESKNSDLVQIFVF